MAPLECINSHSAAGAADALAAVRPVAGGPAAVAVVRCPRPPACPAAPRPASAPPESQLAPGRPHDDVGAALGAVSAPRDARPRTGEASAGPVFSLGGE